MQSISSLAAPSHEIQDTPDEDHVSASLVIVEREVTTVASSPNPESSESTVIPQNDIPQSTYEKEFEETLPSSIGHYKRKTLIDEFSPAKFTVPAMQTDFNTYRRFSPQTGEEEVLPVGWTKHTHSDGKPYFYHDHDKIITEEWLYDIDIAEEVARHISILKDAISKRSESFGRVKSWHLYVEIEQYERPGRGDGNRRFRCRYYFVNHDAECIFWLSNCRLDGYMWELRGEMSPDLVRTAYMMALLRGQILNYHGQRDARTGREESVFGYDHNNRKRTVPFRTMNILLFYAPIKHYTSLHKVWVDRLISRGPWQHLIEQITDKWQQHVGLATILLAVNMAFLAIPSVDEMGAGQQHRFVTQLLCYLSVASSMATIIIGLILVSHHNALKHVDIPVVTEFLERHWQEYIGFERLSIMYSTPYALLMWSYLPLPSSPAVNTVALLTPCPSNLNMIISPPDIYGSTLLFIIPEKLPYVLATCKTPPIFQESTHFLALLRGASSVTSIIFVQRMLHKYAGVMCLQAVLDINRSDSEWTRREKVYIYDLVAHSVDPRHCWTQTLGTPKRCVVMSTLVFYQAIESPWISEISLYSSPHTSSNSFNFPSTNGKAYQIFLLKIPFRWSSHSTAFQIHKLEDVVPLFSIAMPSASAFESSCPQTQWTWIRQTLIEAALLSSAIKLHRLVPSPVWMVWISSSPSRQASQSPPRRSRPILSHMILKVAGDQFIDETSPPLSCALVETVPRPHVDIVRKSQRLPYHTPYLQGCQSLLRLRTKADPWTVRRSSHHSNAYCVGTSSSPGTGDNRIESPFGSGFSPMSSTNIPSSVFQSLRSQFSGAEGRQCPSQVAESSESIVQPQGGTFEHTYDWSNDEIKFQGYLPSRIGHYDRKTPIDEFPSAFNFTVPAQPTFTVPAMQTDFNTRRRMSPTPGEGEVLPMGWTKHTHSDGKPHFYHDHDKIITEEWLYERDIAEKVARYISILKDAISKRSESFDRVKSWHLYVKIAEYELPAWEGDDRLRCGYYFVNHDAECIFWLSEFTLDLSGLRGVEMSSGLIRTAYMMALLRDRISNYRGRWDARTDEDESVYKYDYDEKRTVPFRIANLLLFYAPIKYYISLNNVWVEWLFSKCQQAVLVEQIIYKLNLSNGMATVLLAVNMAFLAIPSVDDMGAHQQPSVTKILICFSVVVSLGSIIIGLFLIGHHTALKHADIITVTNVLERHWQRNLGFERLAIVYSVPQALLMWG
ncbi:uncharacterized protein ARMOST_04187 [Armillaria ostoyae]|uniref:WW domain-containing protein n=1 Tax=Armillaria ostoyae TaxID=47428 RepID=A0A284QWN2_ARMOS|nr:uncharacterized protein ARMOST_04187 [Armillaria ostoyae]